MECRRKAEPRFHFPMKLCIMRIMRTALGLSIALLVTSSRATYGEDAITHFTASVPIRITGFTESPLRVVSGSNVTFGINAGPQYYVPPMEFETYFWRPGDITDMQLTIGGEAIDLLLPPAPDVTWTKSVTFLSNHFNHNATIPIVLTVSSEFEKVSNPGGTILETITKSKSVTVQCKIYNDLLSWRTTVDANGNPDTNPHSYPTVANEGLVAVRPQFTNMKHDVPDNATLTTAEIINPSPARLAEAPGVFAFTHGSPPYVQDSGTGLMDAYEVANAVTSRVAGHPPMSFAIYYACSMFAAAATWFNAHFDSTTNHSFAGFDKNVESSLKKNDRTPILVVPFGKVSSTLATHLSEHALGFIKGLKDGDTSSLALDFSNTVFPPRKEKRLSVDGKNWEYELLDMLLSGDGSATLNRVYGHHEALASIEDGNPNCETLDTWYLTR